MLKWPPVPRLSDHLFRSYGIAEPLYKDALQLSKKVLGKERPGIH
jgi:hypothetical protein